MEPIETVNPVIGRPSFGFQYVAGIPFSEGEAKPLGILQFFAQTVFFVETMLGFNLPLDVGRMTNNVPQTEEEEDEWWRRWEERLETEIEEEEEEEEFNDFWTMEEEEALDMSGVVKEQELFLERTEQWVEKTMGVDGKECVRRFVCELHFLRSHSTSSCSSPHTNHTSFLSQAVHLLFTPQEHHGGEISHQYREAMDLGCTLERAQNQRDEKGCRDAFPSCPLSLFKIFGGYI